LDLIGFERHGPVEFSNGRNYHVDCITRRGQNIKSGRKEAVK
jgi:hypothetical protein